MDEVQCVFLGLTPDHLGYFYEEYGLFKNNYFFNPKFKLGTWDGKLRYFHKTGKTYVNLLSDIIPRIVGLGYEIKIDDKRVGKLVAPPNIDEHFFKDVKHPTTGKPWVMRDYQVNYVNTLIRNNGGVGIAGTGAGKTSMAAAIAKSYELAGGLRSIIIVPDKNLNIQTFKAYENFGLDVGQYFGEKKDTKNQHIVSTWQTLQNMPHFIQDFDVVIVDECHGLRGQVLSKLMNEHGKNIQYRFGVTGTLPKDPCDAMSVRISVGEVLIEIPAHKLQDEGHLAQLGIDVFQHKINLHDQYQTYIETPNVSQTTYSQFRDGYFPDFTAEKSFLERDPTRVQWITDFINTKHEMKSGNLLCLVNGVRFGRNLAKSIPGAHFLSGAVKTDKRQEIFKLFETEDDLTVIATIKIASTGLDIPRIFNLVTVDVGKSFIRVIQTIGRGLRLAEDKGYVHYADLCSDLKYSRKHLTQRKKFYKEAKYKFKVTQVDLD